LVKFVHSAAQSRKDDRNPCTVAPPIFILRSTISSAITDSGLPTF
jgi:hypothetical protein